MSTFVTSLACYASETPASLLFLLAIGTQLCTQQWQIITLRAAGCSHAAQPAHPATLDGFLHLCGHPGSNLLAKFAFEAAVAVITCALCLWRCN
jgi:hypothetical protein